MAKAVKNMVDFEYLRGLAFNDGFETTIKPYPNGSIRTIEFSNDEFEISICLGDWLNQKKVRTYVEGASTPDRSDRPSDEASAEEHTQWIKKYNRNFVKLQKDVIVEALEKFEVVKAIYMNAGFGFYKNAGCSCGCSCGWIFDVLPILRDCGNATIEDIRIVKK